VVDIMRTHPMVIIGGLLHENPFFVPPDEFLRELRERRAMPKGDGRRLSNNGSKRGTNSR
jgi:hypothetical protein